MKCTEEAGAVPFYREIAKETRGSSPVRVYFVDLRPHLICHLGGMYLPTLDLTYEDGMGQ